MTKKQVGDQDCRLPLARSAGFAAILSRFLNHDELKEYPKSSCLSVFYRALASYGIGNALTRNAVFNFSCPESIGESCKKKAVKKLPQPLEF